MDKAAANPTVTEVQRNAPTELKDIVAKAPTKAEIAGVAPEPQVKY
jgi:hypothetical protein